MNTIIVSDIHLGSELSLASKLLNVLQTTDFNRLILLGDIFQDLDFSRLTKDHWKLISYIRKLSNPKRNVEVVWVEGNHDVGISEVMEHLLGVKVFKEYVWNWNNQKCIAVHGHQFDSLFSSGTPFVARLFTPIYLWLQKIHIFKNWLPRILDRFHTHWSRLSDQVKEGALEYAKDKGASFIFCGHTHQTQYDSKNGINYYNCGHWTGELGSLVLISDTNVEIRDEIC